MRSDRKTRQARNDSAIMQSRCDGATLANNMVFSYKHSSSFLSRILGHKAKEIDI
jgi:hypothetical protein